MEFIKKVVVHLNKIRRRNSPKQQHFLLAQKLLSSNGYNICYNHAIRKRYDASKKNILLAIESPEVIKYNQWLDKDMHFVAEISFANFYHLEHYYCCRSLYSTNDNFVNFDIHNQYREKHKNISFIYSDKSHLPGHQLRHAIAQGLGGKIDAFGSGTGKFLKRKEDSLAHYRFQIVVENGKHAEYVSEKFFDCLKTNTMPIYYGGDQGAEKMGFDPRGWLSFNTPEELEQIIHTKTSESFYLEHLPYLEKNRKQLLEIRNNHFLSLALHQIMFSNYMHTEHSYHNNRFDELSFFIE